MPGYRALQYLSSVVGLWVLLYAYDKWIRAVAPRLWVWQGPSWRFYLWLVVLAGCSAEAMIESHTVHAIVSLYFLQNRHFAFVLIASFARNVLVAVCAAAIGVKLFSLRTTQDTAY